MKFGDFSNLAENYASSRPGYSPEIIKLVLEKNDLKDLVYADVGAGTGIFTRQVRDFGVNKVLAIEPNAEMRAKGKSHPNNLNIVWIDGSAEKTKLENSSIDVLSMASSFHWANLAKALVEFKRVIRPNGKFIALWNPRKIADEGIDFEVEKVLKSFIPNYIRKSSGYSPFCENLARTLHETNIFSNIEYFEYETERVISSADYIKLWKSVNDIQVKLGEYSFSNFITKITDIIGKSEQVEVTNVTRAWISVIKS